MLRPDKRLITLGIILVLVAVVSTVVLAVILLAPRQAGSQTASPTGRVVAFTSADPAVGVEIRVPDLGWDRPLGTTPFSASVALSAGMHTYLAAAPGYRAASGQFTITGALDPLQVQVPAMPRLGGQIEVRSSAAAQIAIDGRPAGSCEPNAWTPLGRYDPGRYTVQASTALGSQQMTIAVGQNSGGKADFYWGSRLVVTVVPTNVVSLTVTVDGRPYTRPVEYGYADLKTKPFAHLRVSAPGYLVYTGTVYLRPGETTTATVALVADTRKADVLAAYRRYWEVLTTAYQEMDPSHLPEVITGTMLAQETQAITMSEQFGIASVLLAPSPHTPTVELTGETNASVRAAFDLKQTTVRKNGTSASTTNHWDGAYTFVRCADGAWRALAYTSSIIGIAATPVPTPVAGGSGGGGGGGGGGGSGGGSGRPAPADRALVARIVLASINCARQTNGMAPLAWDQEIADALGPLAEEETAFYHDHGYYDPSFGAKEDAALGPLGAGIINGGGIALSFVPGNAKWGEFAYDWENYVDRPCETGWANGWAGNAKFGHLTRVGIAIGSPYWEGVFWKATILIGAR